MVGGWGDGDSEEGIYPSAVDGCDGWCCDQGERQEWYADKEDGRGCDTDNQQDDQVQVDRRKKHIKYLVGGCT